MCGWKPSGASGTASSEHVGDGLPHHCAEVLERLHWIGWQRDRLVPDHRALEPDGDLIDRSQSSASSAVGSRETHVSRACAFIVHPPRRPWCHDARECAPSWVGRRSGVDDGGAARGG
jgi:hypothetical protein